MSSHHHDVIILGAGGMGSSAACRLAKRGVDVCAIEQFGIAHDLGSSHGDTRVIRRAYYEHPDYVPLLDRTYALWRELENESGTSLMSQCGLIVAGESDSAIMKGQAACYSKHSLPHESLSADEVSHRFPSLKLSPGMSAFFDPQAGYLHVERCVAEHLRAAERSGAKLMMNEKAIGWQSDGNSITVTTNRRTLHAAKLILATGSWTVPVLADLNVRLRVARKVLLWYGASAAFSPGRFPCYLVELPDGLSFYGVPMIDEHGLKVAQHLPCDDFIDDPQNIDRSLRDSDRNSTDAFIREYLPSLKPDVSKHAVCMYTLSPDEHFIIDHHPGYSNVTIAAGFSGHGFKFSAVVGEILADLATQGTTPHPIDFLRLKRFKDN